MEKFFMTDQCNVCLSVSFTTDMRPQKRQHVTQKRNAFSKHTSRIQRSIHFQSCCGEVSKSY